MSKNEIIQFLIKLDILSRDKIAPPNKSKKSHCTCCYCSCCGYLHDECVCRDNEILTEIDKYFDNR